MFLILVVVLVVEIGPILLLIWKEKMLNCRLVVDVGSDFDSLNFAPFRQPYPNIFTKA